MRKIIAAACATSLAAALSVAFAASAAASTTIVVGPGQSIQAAVNRAHPGDTVLVKRGVYHQTVQIRKDGITLRGSGNSAGGTVLKPPKSFPKTVCTKAFGPSGVCVLAKKLDLKAGAVITPVHNDTVTGMRITGFPATGVFGFGTDGLRVTRVVAIKDGAYGIARFVSTRSLFAHNTAIGNEEAGLYVGDSPHADSVVRDNHASGNQLGIFVRHARHVLVAGNHVRGNCEGILVLDDGQKGGAGNVNIRHNSAIKNNKFCPKSEDTPALKGGGILLLGATFSKVVHNHVAGNSGRQVNSGGIVVLSAHALAGGSNPRFDAIVHNIAFRNHPADLIWDGTGKHIKFVANHCRASIPAGLCH